jgi:hypothetical protein
MADKDFNEELPPDHRYLVGLHYRAKGRKITPSSNPYVGILLTLRLARTLMKSCLLASGIWEAFTTEPKERKITPCSAPSKQDDKFAS